MSNENITLTSIYGVDDDLISCPRCGNSELRDDVLKIMLSDKTNLKNWYCSNCKYVWVKGLSQPRYNPF